MGEIVDLNQYVEYRRRQWEEEVINEIFDPDPEVQALWRERVRRALPRYHLPSVPLQISLPPHLPDDVVQQIHSMNAANIDAFCRQVQEVNKRIVVDVIMLEGFVASMLADVDEQAHY